MTSEDDLHKPFLAEVDKLYSDLGHGVLGILPAEITDEAGAGATEIIDSLIQVNLNMRNEFRKQKNWAMADQIRDQLQEAGIVLKDRPDGSTDWKIEK